MFQAENQFNYALHLLIDKKCQLNKKTALRDLWVRPTLLVLLAADHFANSDNVWP